MRGMGILIRQRENIKYIQDELPGKDPFCYRIDPPDDVRLYFSNVGGTFEYVEFFGQAARAQHYAWSSAELTGRYPEFLFAPDETTTEGYAFLFMNLFHDDAWLAEHAPGIRPENAQAVSKSLAFITLANIRSSCASIEYEIALQSSNNVRSGELSSRFAELQKRATHFGMPAELYLANIDDPYCSVRKWRALVFEAALREHLLTRFGRRWWASRKAADELIDLWNTSSRYTVDEIASMVGFGPLSIDLLTEKLTEAVRGD